MSTREQTRRELKDLARLAADMTDTASAPRARVRPLTARSSSVPPPAPGPLSGKSGGSRGTVPPYVVAIPTPQAFARPPRSPISATPLSQAPALAAATPVSRRGAQVLMASATLAASLVGGLLLGQALASHGTAARPHVAFAGSSEATHAEVAVAVPGGVPESNAGAAVPQASALVADPAANAAPSAILFAGGAPPTVTVLAPRPAHHAEPRQPLKPADVVPPANNSAKAPSGTKVSTSRPRSTGHDSLDDLIRKAAAN